MSPVIGGRQQVEMVKNGIKTAVLPPKRLGNLTEEGVFYVTNSRPILWTVEYANRGHFS